MTLDTIATKYREWRELQCAPNTLRIDKKGYAAIQAMMKDKQGPVKAVEKLTSGHADRHMQSRMKGGVGACTINKEMSAAKRMLAWAVSRDKCEKNPLAAWEPLDDRGTREPRAFTLEEVHQLLKATPPEWLVMFRLYLCTGMRRTETLHLRWSEVGERTIKLPKGRTKMRRSRIVYLGPRMAAMLHELPRDSEYVFVNRGWCGHAATGRPYTLRRPRQVMQDAAADAGWTDLSGVSPQSFRVTFSTVALEHDMPLAYVDKLIGHEGKLTVRRYFKPKDLLERAAEVEELVLGVE